MMIAVSAELYDKIYFISSNTMFVICHKFKLQFSTGNVVTYFGCGGIYYIGFVDSLLSFQW